MSSFIYLLIDMTTKIKKLVAEVLTVDVAARDSDVLLYMIILDKLQIQTHNIRVVLESLDYSYVVRQRALLQSKHEYLRWQKYIERQEKWHRLKKVYSPSFWDKIQLMFG